MARVVAPHRKTCLSPQRTSAARRRIAAIANSPGRCVLIRRRSAPSAERRQRMEGKVSEIGILIGPAAYKLIAICNWLYSEIKRAIFARSFLRAIAPPRNGCPDDRTLSALAALINLTLAVLGDKNGACSSSANDCRNRMEFSRAADQVGRAHLPPTSSRTLKTLTEQKHHHQRGRSEPQSRRTLFAYRKRVSRAVDRSWRQDGAPGVTISPGHPTATRPSAPGW